MMLKCKDYWSNLCMNEKKKKYVRRLNFFCLALCHFFEVKMMYDCCGSLDFMNVSKWSGVERLILLDHIAGLNMKVCLAMGMLQLILWAVWAGVTCHPSRWKLWVVVIGGGLASLLEIYDFPPYMGFVDAHALWHGTTIPSTHLWWSFVRGDSEFRTTTLIKKAK